MTGAIASGVQRGVFTATLRAACGGFLVTLRRLTGAASGWGRAFFTRAGVLALHLGAPYRGAVAGRKCGPRSSLLLVRAAGFGRLPASFGGGM